MNKQETPTKEVIEMLWQIKGYFKEVKGNYDEYTKCIQTTIDKLKDLPK